MFDKELLNEISKNSNPSWVGKAILLKLKSKIKAFQLANDLDFQSEIEFLKQQIL